MRRFTVAVDENTAERLTALARAERRDPREQAALLLEAAVARLSHEADRRREPGGSRAPAPPSINVPIEPADR